MNNHFKNYLRNTIACIFVFICFVSINTFAISAEDAGAPATLDEVAAKHQDAILALKHFSFNSEITHEVSGEEPGAVFTATGSVDLEGWSHYVSEAKDGASLCFEYFVKAALPFRYVTIEHKSPPPAADTSEGWELVSTEEFHRDIPLNPLYMFAQFLGNEEPLTESAGASKSKDCRALKASWNDGNRNVEMNLCVAENGLATDFTAALYTSSGETGGEKLILKITIAPLGEPEIIDIPEKVQTLFDDEKKKEEKKSKK